MFEQIIKIFEEYDRLNNDICDSIKIESKLLFGKLKSELESEFGFNTRLDIYKGQVGNMPIVPFFSIFIEDSKWKHTRGFYIVFLFDSDIKNVYMSLAYGTENLGIGQIRELTYSFQSMLLLNSDIIDLNSKSSRPRKYEESSIKSYRYKVKDFSKEFRLENLVELANIYKIIWQNTFFIDVLDIYTNNAFNLGFASNSSETISLKSKRNPISRDRLSELNKLRKEIGNSGEEFALILENEMLEKEGIRKKASIVAVKDENQGYDILSYRMVKGELKEIFIEVKTTVTKTTNFYISQSELLFMKLNKDNYYIYLVTNFDNKSKRGDLVILDYPLINEYEFLPTNYIAKG